MVKKIGILTSGGDCGGLNAVIRAVTTKAVNDHNWKVIGIKDGTLGLLKDPLDIIELTPSLFQGHLMRMGGTILGSNNKGYPSTKKVIDGFQKLNLDALIGIGGDGSKPGQGQRERVKSVRCARWHRRHRAAWRCRGPRSRS